MRSGSLAGYHGAEHIAIGTYEQDAPTAKEHERCGSHLVGPLLLTTAAGEPARLPRSAPGHGRRARLAASLGAVAAVDRDLRLDDRATPTTGSRGRSPCPGHELQHRLSTAEPTPDQLEVGARCARGVPRARRRRLSLQLLGLPADDGSMELLAGLGTSAQNFATNWLPVMFFVLMCFVAYLLWRTTKLMPRVKPMEVTPGSASAVTWDEVAGLDEAKAELQEVVDFLRDPRRFEALGARVPKGILFHGPPGTGKTLAAKAIASESGARFYAQSASAFVEMFAGLGAARIRKLFEEARKNAPSIVFIDELDAVGQARVGHSFNREQDQT